jgi:putative ABC transport system substrate-binding protein
MSGDEEHPGALTEAIGRAMGENRMKARAELKDAIEEERLSVDAKLAELEARLKSVPGKLPVVKSSWQPETVTYSNVEPQLRDLRAAASGLGLQIVALIARDLLVTADGFFFGLQDKLATLAARYGLPAFYPLSDYVRAGGLVSYGANLAESWRQAGTYVARIVKGAKPSDLPIMQPVQFELVINTTTAKALGLEIPPKVLALVDRVVE